MAIYERGQIIGCVGNEFSEYPYQSCYSGRSFLWEQGRMTAVGSLGGTKSEAVAINERGQIVGAGETKAKAKGKDGWPIRHAFLWQNGTMRDLGTFGGSFSYATAINEGGQIVGSAGTKAINRAPDYYEYGEPIYRAFLWQNGKMRNLGALDGPNSEAVAINQRGQVVGSADTANMAAADRHTPEPTWCSDEKYSHSAPHAFLWEKGRIRDLGTLGGLESEAVGINERGQVVGWADTKAKDPDGCRFEHAFVWEDGRMTDLGTLPGGKVSEALAINGSGQIIGLSATKSGSQHAVLWTLKRG